MTFCLPGRGFGTQKDSGHLFLVGFWKLVLNRVKFFSLVRGLMSGENRCAVIEMS